MGKLQWKESTINAWTDRSDRRRREGEWVILICYVVPAMNNRLWIDRSKCKPRCLLDWFTCLIIDSLQKNLDVLNTSIVCSFNHSATAQCVHRWILNEFCKTRMINWPEIFDEKCAKWRVYLPSIHHHLYMEKRDIACGWDEMRKSEKLVVIESSFLLPCTCIKMTIKICGE